MMIWRIVSGMAAIVLTIGGGYSFANAITHFPQPISPIEAFSSAMLLIGTINCIFAVVGKK